MGDDVERALEIWLGNGVGYCQAALEKNSPDDGFQPALGGVPMSLEDQIRELIAELLRLLHRAIDRFEDAAFGYDIPFRVAFGDIRRGIQDELNDYSGFGCEDLEVRCAGSFNLGGNESLVYTVARLGYFADGSDAVFSVSIVKAAVTNDWYFLEAVLVGRGPRPPADDRDFAGLLDMGELDPKVGSSYFL